MNMIRLLVIIIIILIALSIYLVLIINGQKRIMYQNKKELRRILGINEYAYQMILIEIKHRPLRSRLEALKIRKIAIYGMGELGERIMDDIIQNTSIELLYGIDRDARHKKMIIPIYTLEEAMSREKPDLVLLTTYTEGDELRLKIENKMDTKVLSLKEIIYAE